MNKRKTVVHRLVNIPPSIRIYVDYLRLQDNMTQLRRSIRLNTSAMNMATIQFNSGEVNSHYTQIRIDNLSTSLQLAQQGLRNTEPAYRAASEAVYKDATHWYNQPPCKN